MARPVQPSPRFGNSRRAFRAGSTVVAIFPDGGDRYLDTIYSDAWVAENFGADVAELWQRPLIEDVVWC